CSSPHASPKTPQVSARTRLAHPRAGHRAVRFTREQFVFLAGELVGETRAETAAVSGPSDRCGHTPRDTITPGLATRAPTEALAKRCSAYRPGRTGGRTLLADRRSYRRPPCSVLRAGRCRGVPQPLAGRETASRHRIDRRGRHRGRRRGSGDLQDRY